MKLFNIGNRILRSLFGWSLLRATDPCLMTIKENHESTVRYWMECKGYSREEIEKPLTDERYKEIGRSPFIQCHEFQESNRKAVAEKYKGMGILPIADTRELM